MTLNDILTAALAQLDRGHDAQTLESYRVRLTQYANDAQRELADALGLFRTDKVRTSAGIVDTSLLPRRVKRIERVVQLGRAVPFRCGDRTNTLLLPYDTAAEITYRYEPRTLNDNSDRSDLDDGLLGLVVNYVVGRERLGGDVSTQSGGNIYLAMFEAGKAKLRGYIRDDDSFRIVNRY